MPLNRTENVADVDDAAELDVVRVVDGGGRGRVAKQLDVWHRDSLDLVLAPTKKTAI
jgi:hypothetical protein